MAVPKLPALTLTAGPSSAGSTGRSKAITNTGDFSFKSAKKTTFIDLVQTALPFVILGAVYWYVNRK